MELYTDICNLNIKNINEKISLNSNLDLWGEIIDSHTYTNNNLENLFYYLLNTNASENTILLNRLYNSNIDYNNLEYLYSILKYKKPYYELFYNILFLNDNHIKLPNVISYQLHRLYSFTNNIYYNTKSKTDRICILLFLLYKNLDYTFLHFFLNKHKSIFLSDLKLTEKLFQYIFIYITDFSYSEKTEFYSVGYTTNDYSIYYFKFLKCLTIYLEEILDENKVVKIINSINLNNIIG